MRSYSQGDTLSGAIRAAAVAAGALLLAALAPARAERPEIFAIVGARIIPAPGKTIESGTLVIRDGLIEAVGEKVQAPADATVIEGSGKTVTYGFLDACSDIGQRKPPAGPAAPEGGGGGRPPAAPEQPAGTAHPISRVHPEKRVVDSLITDKAAFEKHREMGFTSALSIPADGIFRGQAALINLGEGSPSSNVIVPAAGQVVGFEYGGFGGGYPSSLMGSIAAVRQTLLDTRRQQSWESRYEGEPTAMKRPEHVAAYAALEEATTGASPVIFDAKESPNLVRSLAIAKEFSLDPIVIGSGFEHLEPGAVDALLANHARLILPLAYPDKPKVEDADEALGVSLRDLERWDGAPDNPARLQRAGVPFALGTCRMASPSEFPVRLRKAIERGLPAETALAALTVEPARMLGVEASMGTLEPGRIANVLVLEGAQAGGEGIFAEKSKPAIVFVDGIRHDVEKKKSKGDPNAKVDPRGTWSITLNIRGRAVNRTWTIRGKEGDYSGTAETQEGDVDFTSVKLAGNEMTVVLPGRGGRPSQEMVVVIKGESLEGEGEFPGGGPYTIKGTRTSGPEGGGL